MGVDLLRGPGLAERPHADEPAVRKRLAVEAGVPLGWHKYVGTDGEIHGIVRFGASAPYKDLAREFGYTPEKVVERVEGMLGR